MSVTFIIVPTIMIYSWYYIFNMDQLSAIDKYWLVTNGKNSVNFTDINFSFIEKQTAQTCQSWPIDLSKYYTTTAIVVRKQGKN